jgi:plastocyanin
MNMKRGFRKFHRLIAITVCLPLSVTVVTGLGITIASEWFRHEELGEFLIKVHTGEIFGLAAIYPILNGLGLISLIVTGLSMTGLFSRLYQPKQVLAAVLASAVLMTWLASCSRTAQSPGSLNQPQVAANQPLDQPQLSLPQPNATVKIHNFKFEPAMLKIGSGETVKFVNADEEPHTVTAKDGAFDSKALDSSESWTHTFTATGTFPYICAIHPFMQGTVTVTSAGGKNATPKVH